MLLRLLVSTHDVFQQTEPILIRDPRAPCPTFVVPSDILRALAQIRAHQGRRSSAILLFRRAANAAATGDGTGDPLSLCRLAQLLLAPYPRRRPCSLHSSSLPSDQSDNGGQTSSSGCGTADVPARPETDVTPSPPLTASKKGVLPKVAPTSAMKEAEPIIFPSDEEKNEAARLLARAFMSAGGAMPPEDVYFGSQVVGVADVRKRGDRGAVERGRAGDERDQAILAEVHLAVSGFSLKEGRRGGGSGDAAKEWHLQEAARVAPPDTKTGIIARCVLEGRREEKRLSSIQESRG